VCFGVYFNGLVDYMKQSSIFHGLLVVLEAFTNRLKALELGR
jgi:hypothetical protein